MAQGTDLGVTLQADTLAPVAGGPVRTVSAVIPLGGIPTQVQQQVVVVADPSGVLIESAIPILTAMLEVLKNHNLLLEEIRACQTAFMGFPIIDQENVAVSPPTISQ